MQFVNEKLVWMRKSTGNTQQKMADACGVCKRTWVSYEDGTSDITSMRLVAVTAYCCIDIAIILADVIPKGKKLRKIDFTKIDQLNKEGIKIE